MNSPYISDELPAVAKEVKEVYQRDLRKISSEKNNDYFFHSEIGEIIRRDNPIIFECIREKVGEFVGVPSVQSAIIDVAHEIYFLLRTQAQINSLEFTLIPTGPCEITFGEDISLDDFIGSYKVIGEYWTFPNRII